MSTKNIQIHDPIVVWVLAKLFDGACLDEKELLRKLCQASFDSMSGSYEEFSETMAVLREEDYIEMETRENVELRPTFRNVATLTQDYKEIKTSYRGYVITPKGIFEYRKHIITPIKSRVEKASSYSLTGDNQKELRELLDTLRKEGSDMAAAVVKACINNAPIVIDFISKLVKIVSH